MPVTTKTDLFARKVFEHYKKGNSDSDLGIQNVFTPIRTIESNVNSAFHDFLTPETKNVAVIFNWEFFVSFGDLKPEQNSYIKNIKFTYFYDSELDVKMLRAAAMGWLLEQIELVNISEFTEENKDFSIIEKAMSGKHFDIVFSNPPYNDGLDLKILSTFKNTFKKAIIIHPAVWILENKCVGYIGKFKKEFQNNIEKVLIFRGNMFGVPFMSALDICVFNNEKTDTKIEVDDQVTNCKYLAKDHTEITKFGDCWLKFGIDEFAKKFDSEKSILRHIYFDREHLENLKYPIKLSMIRSGNPHFNDGYFDEKLGYYVLNKTNCFFTCIAKGDPEKYHFNCDWNVPNNQKLLFNFNTENERKNFYNYCKTKFFRFLFSFYKEGANCHNGSISGIKPDSKLDSYPMKLIPWLDFTQEWNDAKLCKEFGIDKELWQYIDNFIPDYYEDYTSGFEVSENTTENVTEKMGAYVRVSRHKGELPNKEMIDLCPAEVIEYLIKTPITNKSGFVSKSWTDENKQQFRAFKELNKNSIDNLYSWRVLCTGFTK